MRRTLVLLVAAVALTACADHSVTPPGEVVDEHKTSGIRGWR